MTDKPKVLNPWEELAQVKRPSIFMADAQFRAKNPSNQIKNEEGLHIHRLLAPERAVVVEGGDTLGGNNIVWRTLGRDPFDKGDD